MTSKLTISGLRLSLLARRVSQIIESLARITVPRERFPDVSIGLATFAYCLLIALSLALLVDMIGICWNTVSYPETQSRVIASEYL